MLFRMLQVNFSHGPVNMEQGIGRIEKDDLNSALRHGVYSLLCSTILTASRPSGKPAGFYRMAQSTASLQCISRGAANAPEQTANFGVSFDRVQGLC